MDTKTKKAIKLPRVLISLGRAVEVKGATVHYTWPAKENVQLCCDSTGKKLYCIQTQKTPTSKEAFSQLYRQQRDAFDKGVDLYERWHEFEVDSGSVLKPPRGFLFCVDRCESIIYASDKWSGRMQKYIHEFKTPPLIWVNHKTEPRVCVLTGGKIRTTAKGITG